jgi:translation initiation factor 5B
MSSKSKPSAGAIAALKARLATQKAAAATAELATREAVQREREEKERLEIEAAAALAHRRHLADLRAARREQDRRAGKLQTKGERAVANRNKAFVASLGKDRVMASSASAAAEPPPSTGSEEKKEQMTPTCHLRAPICCLIGRVDAGKSSLLDRICGTRVAAQEAGGITQQMGASEVPLATIQRLTAGNDVVDNFPGAWFLDTPGHASFHSFRKRGTSVCDVALVVINLLQGIEATTHDSIRALREAGIPLLFLLNKVDKCYGWKTSEADHASESMANVLARQPDNVRDELQRRVDEIARDLHHQHMIVATLQSSPPTKDVEEEEEEEEDEQGEVLPLVPVSAKTGQGLGDVFRWLARMPSVTSQLELDDEKAEEMVADATVLEVHASPGVGTALDVLLVRGRIGVGDTVVLAGWGGEAITTHIRALHCRGVQAVHVDGTACLQLVAPGMDQAVAGSRLVVLGKGEEEDEARVAVMHDVTSILSRLVPQGKPGIVVHASTLGALEAALDLLTQQQVPVASIGIGPVTRASVQRALVQLDSPTLPELAAILAFDTSTHKDASALAHETKLAIFSSDVLYDACERVVRHLEAAKQARRLAAAAIATYPVVLDILPDCIFRTKNPIVLGVRVREGIAKVGTQLCCLVKSSSDASSILVVGKITRILLKDVEQQQATTGTEVSIQITGSESDTPLTFGRQFGPQHQLMSRLTRESIDALKQHYRQDVCASDWQLVVRIKKALGVAYS